MSWSSANNRIMSGLWKKESSSGTDDAIYIDLFESLCNKRNNATFGADNHQFLNIQVKPGKNNNTSNDFKAKGNFEFGNGRWVEAMEFYNQSLCFAELGSDNVSFAFANRATCFLQMKKFEKCLKDIKLAIATNYPPQLMPKLLKRKANCEDLMKNYMQTKPFDPKLSFDPSKQFPCMADVVEIQQNEEFGRHMVAKRDIGVGKTILIEEAYVSIARGWDRVNCFECLQTVRNFIACPNCTDVMFCDDDCLNRNEVHKRICGMSVNRMSTPVRYIAKSIIIALIAFKNANELIDFVEDYLSKRTTQLPIAGNDPKSKYALFLTLQSKEKSILDRNLQLVYKMFSGLMNIPLIKREFPTKEKQRFLMHSVGEHFLIMANNSFGGLTNESYTGTTALLLSLFNHACAPNIFNSSAVNKEVCITMRPIKKGEQLFIKYLCGDRTTRERQGILLGQWHFLCKCDKCIPRCERADRLRMKNDACLKALQSAFSFKYTGFKYDPILPTKCVQFLEKYGHLPWSVEMDVALKYYTQCLLDPFPAM